MDGDRDERFGEDGQPRKKSGCGKWIGGCVVLLVIGAIFAGYLAMKLPQMLRWGGAKMVTTMAEAVIDESLQLPEEERDAVMAPIEDLADQVVDGEVEVEVAVAALGEVFESNDAAAVVLHAFESRYVDSDIIPAEEREAAQLTANRFASGILDGRIPRHHLEPLSEIVIERRQGSEGEDVRIKEELSAEDVQQALTIMGGAVDEHAVEDPYHKRSPQELSALVDRAIERALAEERYRQENGPPGGEPDDAAPVPQPRPEPRDENDLGPAL